MFKTVTGGLTVTKGCQRQVALKKVERKMAEENQRQTQQASQLPTACIFTAATQGTKSFADSFPSLV